MGNVKDILTVIILASTLLLSCFSFSHFPHSSDFFLSYALLLSSVQFSHSFLSDSLRPQALHGASLSITNSQSLLKLTSIELVMPSNHLILYDPLLLSPSIFPSIRIFSNELTLLIRWPKYWSFSFTISPSNEYSVLISFRIDWFDLLDAFELRCSKN